MDIKSILSAWIIFQLLMVGYACGIVVYEGSNCIEREYTEVGKYEHIFIGMTVPIVHFVNLKIDDSHCKTINK